jgi:hypothetical protein
LKLNFRWPERDVKNRLQNVTDLFDDITEATINVLSQDLDDILGYMKQLTSVKKLTIYRIQTFDKKIIECLRDHLLTYTDLEELSLYIPLTFTDTHDGKNEPESELIDVVRQCCPKLKRLRVNEWFECKYSRQVFVVGHPRIQ